MDLSEVSPNTSLDQSRWRAIRIVSHRCLLIILFFFTVKKQVSIAPSALEACRNADAIVIATEWKEFKEIDWKQVHASMNKPAFVFDGRLLVDVEKLTQIGFKVRFPILFLHVSAHWVIFFHNCRLCQSVAEIPFENYMLFLHKYINRWTKPFEATLYQC